MNIIQLC